jgi:hypothetical protein
MSASNPLQQLRLRSGTTGRKPTTTTAPTTSPPRARPIEARTSLGATRPSTGSTNAWIPHRPTWGHRCRADVAPQPGPSAPLDFRGGAHRTGVALRQCVSEHLMRAKSGGVGVPPPANEDRTELATRLGPRSSREPAQLVGRQPVRPAVQRRGLRPRVAWFLFSGARHPACRRRILVAGSGSKPNSSSMATVRSTATLARS